MAYEISWSENALEDYENIIDYLINQWSLSIATKKEITVQINVSKIFYSQTSVNFSNRIIKPTG